MSEEVAAHALEQAIDEGFEPPPPPDETPPRRRPTDGGAAERAAANEVAAMIQSLSAQLDERMAQIGAEIRSAGGRTPPKGTPKPKKPLQPAGKPGASPPPRELSAEERAAHEQEVMERAIVEARAAETARQKAEQERKLQALQKAAAGSAAPQEGIVELPSELAEAPIDDQLLLAAMNAQLLEATAALAQRQQECERMGRE
eukprot:3244827-Prymnesium_polylepis.1